MILPRVAATADNMGRTTAESRARIAADRRIL